MHALLEALVGHLAVTAGTVAGTDPDGHVLVAAGGLPAPLPARFRRTSRAAPPRLRTGDPVLLALDAERGAAYVLGRIEPFPPAAPEAADGEDVHLTGRRVVIEAAEGVELRCGDGAVTIRETGKVVVRGTEVVSRARGANKVRGASVAIN